MFKLLKRFFLSSCVCDFILKLYLTMYKLICFTFWLLKQLWSIMFKFRKHNIYNTKMYVNFLSHNRCSDKIGNTHNIHHVYHMKSGTSLPCRNHQTFVQDTKDKTRHNTRKGPTTHVQSGLPTRARTMTDMELHHI